MSLTTQRATPTAHTESPSPPTTDRFQEKGTQVTNTKERKDTDHERPEGPEPAKTQDNEPLAPVYSQYHKMATQQDKEVVNGWNETLNILLTFAGLLSAVITAFLLASQPDLKPGPNELTNKILLHISRQLDNATDISQLIEEPVSRSSAVRTLTYWHGSLGCSLLSAFGSLLSKQWVLHYQSDPIWANTIKQKCLLREVRVYGLSKWRMYAIIESLPVLLQLAVCLFYLGLAESVSGIPTLFSVTVAFAGAIAAFYIFTLITGAFSPSCPFKSPITDVFRRISSFTVILLIYLVAGAVLLFFTAMGLLVCLCSAPWGISQALGNGMRTVAGIWWLLALTLPKFRFPRSSTGERDLAEKDRWVGSVVFWWLQESQSKEKYANVKMMEVEGLVLSIKPDVALKMATWRGGFESRCLQVFRELEGGHPLSKTTLLEADLMCRLMDLSPAGMKLIRPAIAGVAVPTAVSIPPSYDVYMYSCLRRVWTESLDAPAGSLAPLPALKMKPSTLSLYIRQSLLFHSDDDSHPYRAGSDRDKLVQELLIIIRYSPDRFSSRNKYLDFITDTILVAVLALGPGDTLPSIRPLLQLRKGKPSKLDRLLQSIRQLSNYPHDQPPNELFHTAVHIALKALQPDLWIYGDFKKFYSCATWKNGEFAESLYRLLRLGRVWWHAEVGANTSSYGVSLVHTTHLLMHKAILLEVEEYGGGRPKLLCPSQVDVEEILAAYPHPDLLQPPSLEHNTSATTLLNLILSLRYTILPSPRRRITLPSHIPPKLGWSRTPSFTPNINDHPRVIRQLIHDIKTAPPDSKLRCASLSVVIKGQDMFLPAAVSEQFPSLVSDLEHLADEMFQTGNFVHEISGALYAGFNKWEELLQALEELQRVLGHPVAQIQDAALETTIGEAALALPSAPECLEIGSTLQDTNDSCASPAIFSTF